MALFFKNVSFFCLLILIYIFFTSCATHKPSLKPSSEPAFKINDLTKGGIAVFPVFIGEDCRFIPRIGNFAITAGVELSHALNGLNSEMILIKPNQVNSILSNRKLSEVLSNIEKKYTSTGIIDIDSVKAVIKPFNVQYFMFSSIDSLFGSESITYKPQAEAKMSAKIYDKNTYELVSDVSVSVEEIVVRVLETYPYEETVIKASKSLLNALFSSLRNIESNLSIGLLGGINYSNVYTADPIFKPKSEPGILFAGVGQLHIWRSIYFQPQVQYLQKRAFFKAEKNSHNKIKWSYNFIDIPILFQIKSKPKISRISQFISIGPSLCFNWKQSTKITDGVRDKYFSKKNRLKTVFDFAWVIGTGFEYSFNSSLKFSSNLQYFWSMYNMHKYDTWRFRTFKLMAGFLFYL